MNNEDLKKNALELMAGELDSETAVKLSELGWWEGHGPKEVALAQLNQEFLCMPIDKFQEKVEEACGCPVFTHQLANPEHLIARIEKGTSLKDPLSSLVEALQNR